MLPVVLSVRGVTKESGNRNLIKHQAIFIENKSDVSEIFDIATYCIMS